MKRQLLKQYREAVRQRSNAAMRVKTLEVYLFNGTVGNKLSKSAYTAVTRLDDAYMNLSTKNAEVRRTKKLLMEYLLKEELSLANLF